nr:hypothetical protein CFP56_16609 [Quercus suber]
MPVLLEIRFHRAPERRIVRAEREPLDAVDHRLVLVDVAMAGVALRLLGPRDQLVEVHALRLLPVAERVPAPRRRHGRVVGVAHEVLPQRVEAVPDVPDVVRRVLARLPREGGGGEVFFWGTTNKAVELVEDFDEVHLLRRVPGKGPRGRETLAGGPFRRHGDDGRVDGDGFPVLVGRDAAVIPVFGVVDIKRNRDKETEYQYKNKTARSPPFFRAWRWGACAVVAVRIVVRQKAAFILGQRHRECAREREHIHHHETNGLFIDSIEPTRADDRTYNADSLMSRLDYRVEK